MNFYELSCVEQYQCMHAKIVSWSPAGVPAVFEAFPVACPAWEGHNISILIWGIATKKINVIIKKRSNQNQNCFTCLAAPQLHPAKLINLPTPVGQSLIWVAQQRKHVHMLAVTYFLQSWSQLLEGRLLRRNLWVLQPRWEPTLGKVCFGLFSQPSTASKPRRWPRPAGSLGWWPPQWGRSYWQGCQDRNGIFLLACNQSAPSRVTWEASGLTSSTVLNQTPQSLDKNSNPSKQEWKRDEHVRTKCVICWWSGF